GLRSGTPALGTGGRGPGGRGPRAGHSSTESRQRLPTRPDSRGTPRAGTASRRGSSRVGMAQPTTVHQPSDAVFEREASSGFAHEPLHTVTCLHRRTSEAVGSGWAIFVETWCGEGGGTGWRADRSFGQGRSGKSLWIREMRSRHAQLALDEFDRTVELVVDLARRQAIEERMAVRMRADRHKPGRMRIAHGTPRDRPATVRKWPLIFDECGGEVEHRRNTVANENRKRGVDEVGCPVVEGDRHLARLV